MIRTIHHSSMGKSEQGWLHSTFHFSFAEYYNPANLQFGALRVVNDDLFDPQSGFGTHPHRDMEIVSYVVNGALTHQDSMGNRRELTRGQVQYMSAGTGVTHSEFNLTDGPLRFLQIWILPDKSGHKPNYGDYRFPWEEREGRWLRIASGSGGAPVQIHQDMELSVVFLAPGQEISYSLKQDRQAYLIQIEGSGAINGHALAEKDAAEITQEAELTLRAEQPAHYILFDMKAAPYSKPGAIHTNG